MTGNCNRTISRRAVLAGSAAIGAVAVLPGCAGGQDDLGGLSGGALAGVGGAFSLADALRRLLVKASERAFARLGEPGEFWDEKMAALGLAELTGSGANALSRMLTSGPFKAQLENQFGRLAADVSKRAAPLVYRSARNIDASEATALLRRKPGAATAFLRRSMGNRLLDALVSDMGRGLRTARDASMGELVGALNAAGVDVGKIANRLGGDIEKIIWEEITEEEIAIRADPAATRDLLLIRVFGAE
jgi:hypothetical protein